jgi:hypothetical protein
MLLTIRLSDRLLSDVFPSRTIPEKSNPRANCDLDDWMELEGKNPVSILNELYPGIQYQVEKYN